ncbi:bifunctional lytic transglycosylase/C40 family peptidase [Actinomyces sp. 594]|uniref:C40 family peptidase n=1 Tax=Actinomyces sp. 594 TaxID=2057793 RepID=UPI00214C9379|nr:bifunctional lytic transglycosylase/C40 family peptidase [Actinomyces sp. 594]
MKGLRSSDGWQATSNLGRLNLNRRTTSLIGHAGHAAGQVAHAPGAVGSPGDGDLIDNADQQLKDEATSTVKTASQGVKRTADSAIKTARTRTAPTVKHAMQDGAKRIGRQVEPVRSVASSAGGRAVGGRAAGRAMGTRTVRGGIVATTRRAAAQRAAAKAKTAAAKTGARTGVRAARTGAAATRQAAQAASLVARIAATVISALSSTPGLIVAAVAVSIAVAIATIISIIPGIGNEADKQQRSATLTVTIPAEYLDIVTRAGSVCPEITPNLIAAQIQQESSWDPTAGSDQGAQAHGISQFTPSTWAESGLDGNGDGKADVWDPEDAIWSQGNLMCSLVSDIQARIDDGRLPDDSDVVSLALAAYNAGLGAVDAAGGIPVNGETEKYVPAILAAAGGSTDDGGVSADLIAAVEWAKTVAADDRYRYVWGGNGIHQGGYDCSGLTSAVYRRLGISLPRTAAQQQQVGTAVTRDQLKVGDLIFWGDPAYHVAVYAGDGWMVSADSPFSGINYEPIYGSPSSYRRIQ